MKIIILYGVGEVAKRNWLKKVANEFNKDSIFRLDLKEDSLSSLQNTLASSPLFTNKRLIVVENTPPGLNLENIGNCQITTLIIVTGALGAKSVLMLCGQSIKAQFINFEGEKEVSAFPYLDNLIERRGRALVELQKLLPEYGGVYVLSMIYYLLRRNILPLPSSVFFKKKIVAQKQRYSLDNFRQFYKLALETEYKIKNGLLDDEIGLTLLTQKFMVG